jgi:dihydroneopterin aldolase
MYIRLGAIQLFAHHGVYDEEVKNGNKFEIDLEVELPDMHGAASDDLNDTLDYAKLYRTVIEVSEKRRYQLLEAFANDICTEILAAFPTVRQTAVKIRKLDPPLGRPVKNVEVELLVERHDA